MSKTNEKGPKKVDKTQYQELMKEHAQQHAESIKSGALAAASQTKEESPVREAWRKSDIEALAAKEAQKELMAE